MKQHLNDLKVKHSLKETNSTAAIYVPGGFTEALKQHNILIPYSLNKRYKTWQVTHYVQVPAKWEQKTRHKKKHLDIFRGISSLHQKKRILGLPGGAAGGLGFTSSEAGCFWVLAVSHDGSMGRFCIFTYIFTIQI